MTDHAPPSPFSSSPTSSIASVISNFNNHLNHELKDLPDGILHKVFGNLGIRDLCRASTVCKRWRKLNSDKASQKRWCQFYSKRWSIERITLAQQLKEEINEEIDWRQIYGEKAKDVLLWNGQYHGDTLLGHKAGVKCIKLLPECNLLATGSTDRTVRLWDLKEGMPLGIYKNHGGSVRCIGLNQNTLVSGSADKILRIWDLTTLDNEKPNLSSPEKLHGHTGPISTIMIKQNIIYTGSWDSTVRVWNDKQCIAKWQCGDWVWATAALGNFIAIATSPSFIIKDMETGYDINIIQDFKSDGRITTLVGSEDGRYVISGSLQGKIRLFDVRCIKNTKELLTYESCITGLAFEDPWLAITFLDSPVCLNNIEQSLHAKDKHLTGVADIKKNPNGSTCRYLASTSSSLLCVDISNKWVAFGSNEGIVKTCNFSRAEEAAKLTKFSRERRKMKKLNKIIQSQKNSNITNNNSNSNNIDEEEEEEEKEINEEKKESLTSRSLITTPVATIEEMSPIIPNINTYVYRRQRWSTNIGYTYKDESPDENEAIETYA